MTREEAIMELKQFSGTTGLKLSANFWTALDMAIKSLEKEPFEDAISRVETVQFLADHSNDFEDAKVKMAFKAAPLLVNNPNNLPSVTPTKCIATVKFSKEDIQELVEEKMKDIVVERKKGKWIPPKYDDGMSDPIEYQVRCSVCGFDIDPQTYAMELKRFGANKYCPHCGADMRGEEE